jgi:photosystem II stability/assembly factor-like uncharacterized protein
LEGYTYLGGNLLIDPQDPSTLYLPNAQQPYTNYLLKSTDGAASWAPIWGGAYSAGSIFALAIDPQNSTTLYGAGFGAFKSTDGGATWIEFRLPPEAYNENDEDQWIPIISLAVDPQNSSVVYAGGSGGVFKSIDGGVSWNGMNTGLIPKPQNWFDGNHSLVIDPLNPNNVYASSPYYGVVKSSDGAASWSAANSGLPSSTFFGLVQYPVSSLAIDPQDPRTVYAAIGGLGVFAITFAPDAPSPGGIPGGVQ